MLYKNILLGIALVLVAAQLNINKMGVAQSAIDAPALTQADLGVTIAAASPNVVVPGGQIEYNITVTNKGPNPASNVRVAFSINLYSFSAMVVGGSAPSGWSCIITPDGKSRVCERASPMPSGITEAFTAKLDPERLGVFGGVYVSAVVSSSTEDPVGENNSISPGDVTVTTSLANADIALQNQGYSNNSAQPGSRVVFSFNAHNDGPAMAPFDTNLTVPAGATLLGTLEAEYECVDGITSSTCRHGPALLGPQQVIRGMMLLPTSPGNYTSTVTALSGLIDPLPGNNSASAPITVGSMITNADLMIKSVDVKPLNGIAIRPGAGVIYKTTVHNNGPMNANHAEVVIPLFQNSDPEMGDHPTFHAIKHAPPGWSCSSFSWGRAIRCETLVFAANTDASFMTVFAAGQTPGTFNDRLGIGSDSGDSNTSNNLANVSMVISNDTIKTARLHVEAQHQTGQIPVPSGAPVSFVFMATNDGPDPALNAVIDVSWDHYGGAWNSATIAAPAGWVCGTRIGGANAKFCAANHPLAINEKAVFTVNAQAPVVGELSDMRVCALLTSETHNDLPTYNGGTVKSACDTYLVTPHKADIQVQALDSPDPVNAGGTLTYSISVRNLGPDPLIQGYHRTLDMEVAPGIAFQEMIAPPGWVAVYTLFNNWQFEFPQLAVGEVSTVKLIVAAPSITGTITSTATVRGSDFDMNLIDNTTVITTRVSLGRRYYLPMVIRR